MAVFLFLIGALSVIAGGVALGYGFVIELSFGNSLIVTGAMGVTGGLIVIGLGAAVSQLRTIAELLAARQDFSHASEVADQAGARVTFPQKPKVEPKAETPAVVPPHLDEEPPRPGASFAPPRNPEDLLGAAEEGEETPVAAPRRPPPPLPGRLDAEVKSPAKPMTNGTPPAWPQREPPWRASQAPAATNEPPFFDAPWAGQASPKAEPSPLEDVLAQPAAPMPDEAPARETRAAAILKSGVVDGMGYTLYVDGSIEAELPQGTLRFNSIGDLRQHLEKNS
jgi:hypothetical protein